MTQKFFSNIKWLKQLLSNGTIWYIFIESLNSDEYLPEDSSYHKEIKHPEMSKL